MRVIRAVVRISLLVGAAMAAWAVFVRVQGDSEVVYESSRLSDVRRSDGTISGTTTLTNHGKQDGVIRKIEGRVVSGGSGRVLVTRQGSRPHERGWWVSNILEPGQSCVAEVDIVLDQEPDTPVTILLDAHEIGRGLIAHRSREIVATA